METKLKIARTCIQCDLCRPLCPEKAIHCIGGDFILDQFGCTQCQLCIEICPVDAIKELQED